MRPRLKNIYFGHLFIWLLGGVLHLSFSLRFSHIEKLQESSAKQLADFQKSQLEDSERSRLAMLGILEDLKNSEKNNRLIAERFALATQAADLGVYDYNLVSNEIIWDSTMYEIYGLDKETFTLDFDSWVSRVHPDDRSRVVPEFKEILQSDGQFNTEFRIIKPDGTIAFIHAVAEFHESRSGNPERVVGINWDVTEMRIAEQQYSQIIKTSNDGFWIMGTDGSLLEVNEAYCQMVGYSREELLSMNARDMETEPGKFESVVKDIQQHGHLRYETKHSCKGGAVIDVQLNCQLDQNLNGRIFTFVQDISLRTKADLEVQKNLKELQRWYNVTLKREVRVKELKNEVNSLLVKAGLERKYTTISNSE